MNAILNLGKYLFAIPFAIFGLFHFMSGPDLNSAVSPPGGIASVYISGVALIAAPVSMLIGKYDKLASVLLALLMLLFVFIVHLPGVMAENQMAMSGLLKDLMLAGGALIYAKYVARDKSIIG